MAAGRVSMFAVMLVSCRLLLSLRSAWCHCARKRTVALGHLKCARDDAIIGYLIERGLCMYNNCENRRALYSSTQVVTGHIALVHGRDTHKGRHLLQGRTSYDFFIWSCLVRHFSLSAVGHLLLSHTGTCYCTSCSAACT